MLLCFHPKYLEKHIGKLTHICKVMVCRPVQSWYSVIAIILFFLLSVYYLWVLGIVITTALIHL